MDIQQVGEEGSGMNDAGCVLFLVVAEPERYLYERLAEVVRSVGVSARCFTWIQSLVGANVELLPRTSTLGLADAEGEASRVLGKAGYADLSMAADGDRDWKFASRKSKSSHVLRLFVALSRVLDEATPNLIVTSVGGETPRVVLEALARERGIELAIYNAIPVPGRYVLLRAMSAPFIPYPDENTSHRPVTTSYPSRVPDGRLGQPPGRLSLRRGLLRVRSQLSADFSYPHGGVSRKVANGVARAYYRALPSSSSPMRVSAEEVSVLYPLHDEHDFQVAVREAHALPQEAFLRYVCEHVGPGVRVFVKPHPEHLVAHHASRWRSLTSLPNVTFLSPDVPAKDALEAVDVVLTLASSMGYEALALHKPVVCYGSPFYSRRGATVDVGDLRELPARIREAAAWTVNSDTVDSLVGDVRDWSWPGRFTPLERSAENVHALSMGLIDILKGAK